MIPLWVRCQARILSHPLVTSRDEGLVRLSFGRIRNQQRVGAPDFLCMVTPLELALSSVSLPRNPRLSSNPG